jgi:hypothetical protein
MTQQVVDHPAQIIGLQKQITDLKSQQFLPPQWDHTEMENQIRTLRYEQDEARWRPPALGADEDLQHERADMTRDAYESGEEVHGLRMQLG